MRKIILAVSWMIVVSGVIYLHNAGNNTAAAILMGAYMGIVISEF